MRLLFVQGLRMVCLCKLQLRFMNVQARKRKLRRSLLLYTELQGKKLGLIIPLNYTMIRKIREINRSVGRLLVLEFTFCLGKGLLIDGYQRRRLEVRGLPLPSKKLNQKQVGLCLKMKSPDQTPLRILLRKHISNQLRLLKKIFK